MDLLGRTLGPERDGKRLQGQYVARLTKSEEDADLRKAFAALVRGLDPS